MSIANKDLYDRKYTYNELKSNIYAVSLLDILKTQDLTLDFCVKYILNEDFQLLDEDKTITINTVNKYQPHLSKNKLINSLINNKKLGRKGFTKRIDSFEDFESYMNRHLT
jgi:hypothetical protein